LDDSGVLNVSIGLDRRNLETTLRLILAQFELLCDKLVGDAEMKRAREYAVGTSRMSLERPSSQSMRIGGSVLVYGKIIEPEVAHARIRSVTAEEIRGVAREVLNPARLTLALIGPEPETKMIERVLGL
jgi:predicted Zn-dependent peptidase